MFGQSSPSTSKSTARWLLPTPTAGAATPLVTAIISLSPAPSLAEASQVVVFGHATSLT